MTKWRSYNIDTAWNIYQRGSHCQRYVIELLHENPFTNNPLCDIEIFQYNVPDMLSSFCQFAKKLVTCYVQYKANTKQVFALQYDMSEHTPCVVLTWLRKITPITIVPIQNSHSLVK